MCEGFVLEAAKDLIPFDRPLSSTDLNYLSRKILKIPNYRGAFSKDKLSKKIWAKGECGIINLEDYEAGGGTHWSAYATRPGDHGPCYFDSFRDLPPPTSLTLSGLPKFEMI